MATPVVMPPFVGTARVVIAPSGAIRAIAPANARLMYTVPSPAIARFSGVCFAAGSNAFSVRRVAARAPLATVATARAAVRITPPTAPTRRRRPLRIA